MVHTEIAVWRIPYFRHARSLEFLGTSREFAGKKQQRRFRRPVTNERTTPMKKTLHNTERAMAPAENEGKPHRFQIYRQGQAGNYSPGFSTNSAAEAVEAFLTESPAFEGGEMHLWNHREQRVCASVKWNISRTEFGFPVRQRANAFYDGLLDVIVRQIHEREAMRESIQHSVRMSA
jgi:hypothetical protein